MEETHYCHKRCYRNSEVKILSNMKVVQHFVCQDSIFTIIYIDGFKNKSTQVLPLMRPRVALENHIITSKIQCDNGQSTQQNIHVMNPLVALDLKIFLFCMML